MNIVSDRSVEDIVVRREPEKMLKKMQRETGGNKARIMIVDDHALVRQSLRLHVTSRFVPRPRMLLRPWKP